MGGTSEPSPASINWPRAQQKKREYITQAARHALEQQKRDCTSEKNLPFPGTVSDGPGMRLLEKHPASLKIALNDIHAPHGQPVADTVHFRLAKPLDMLANGSGLAMTVEAEHGASRDMRLGMRLTAVGGKKQLTILPYIPVVNAWGDSSHEIYFDWAFANYAAVEDAIEVLQGVEAVTFLAGASLRAPERGGSSTPQSATVRLSDLRLVDYLQGSYDPARHRWGGDQEPDLTLQHRCQEVTGVVATYGGDEGLRSAVESLDLCARTQCWDGSFLDGRRGARTVTSGEYTFGFTIYGTLTGYLALEAAEWPALAEEITVGPRTMARRALYQEMFYRAAMSRAGIALPQDYRDDIIASNTSITGANRVLGYAIAMHMVAAALDNEARKRAVLAKYDLLMDAIVSAQGTFSGGFPILAEGDRYEGEGIHYDSSYIRTHMDWLIVGAQRTDDPRFIHILRRYQDVFEAAMDAAGTGLLPLISERGDRHHPVRLIVPDSTSQVGMAHRLPVVAQWGYNCSLSAWEDPEAPGSTNFWHSASHMRGYRLGAFAARLLDDFVAEPKPRDLGYLFPRQYPIWSATLFTKAGDPVRTSVIRVLPDGTKHDDFKIEVGLYPVAVGVPIEVESPGGTVLAEALELSGWPGLLPADAKLVVSVEDRPCGTYLPNQPIEVTISGRRVISVVGPDVELPPEANGQSVPFRAVFSLEPEESGRELIVAFRVLRGAAPPAEEEE